MRIALFHSTLPEQGRKVGGVEVFVHRLGNHLHERGHDVTMFAFSDPPGDARYRAVRPGRPVFATGKAARLALAPLVLNRLDQRRFDVLHLHGDDWFFLRRRVPTVRTMYGSAWHEARTATSARRRIAQTLVFPLEITASRLATKTFDIGSALPAGYRSNGSLKLAVEEASEGEPNGRAPRPTLLFVGTWHGRKRGAFLADVFERHVLPRHPTAELVMVSDRCEQRPGVRWVRFPSDEELSALYHAAWAFCMPSTYEGFGMPYLEAMVHGLPVVTTPNPGAFHVLGGGAGEIVDDATLGSALADILGDPGRRSRLAEAGSRRALAFTWANVLEEHEAAYGAAIRQFGVVVR